MGAIPCIFLEMSVLTSKHTLLLLLKTLMSIVKQMIWAGPVVECLPCVYKLSILILAYT